MTEILSPQQNRKRMIEYMVKWIYVKGAKEWFEVGKLKRDFMFNFGSSKVRTDEYFELCIEHIFDIEFNEDRTKYRIKPKTEAVSP